MNTQTISKYAQNLLDTQNFIEDKLREFEAIIAVAKKGPAGLTLDSDKTPEWKEAKRQHGIYFAAYRRINGDLSKIRKCVGYENVNGSRVPVYQYKD